MKWYKVIEVADTREMEKLLINGSPRLKPGDF